MAKAKNDRPMSPKQRQIAMFVLTYLISYLVLGGLGQILIAPRFETIPLAPTVLAVHGLLCIIVAIFTKDATSLGATIMSFVDFLGGGYWGWGWLGAGIGFGIWAIITFTYAVLVQRKIDKNPTQVVQKQPVVNVQNVHQNPRNSNVNHRVAFAGAAEDGRTAEVGYSLQEIIGMGDVTLATEALKAETERNRLAAKERELHLREIELHEAKYKSRLETWERWLNMGKITEEEFNLLMAGIGERGFAEPVEPDPEGIRGPKDRSFHGSDRHRYQQPEEIQPIGIAFFKNLFRKKKEGDD